MIDDPLNLLYFLRFTVLQIHEAIFMIVFGDNKICRCKISKQRKSDEKNKGESKPEDKEDKSTKKEKRKE